MSSLGSCKSIVPGKSFLSLWRCCIHGLLVLRVWKWHRQQKIVSRHRPFGRGDQCLVLFRPFRRTQQRRLDCGGREIGIVIVSLGVVTLGLLVVERPSCVVVICASWWLCDSLLSLSFQLLCVTLNPCLGLSKKPVNTRRYEELGGGVRDLGKCHKSSVVLVGEEVVCQTQVFFNLWLVRN